ncbi:hypothetical protein CC80DRAFT_408791 [Byssothecium circinans]|uniref:Aminoglycoside phosphotransferase domain-containing protein n=1 Tax=Byssothecium circinans TaxID=147558 RepID=A0A6A5U1I4_9PLEO|nr:hypothetical protein CC80DRAFT_408791 [Byssothecium circinans]
MTYQFLREQGTKNIPLVKEMHHFGKPGDEFRFTIMSKAKGQTLHNVWPSLSPEEKKGCAKQIIAALRELRQFTSPVPRRVDGGPLWDNIIGQCHPVKHCKSIGKTTEEWFKGMHEELVCGTSRLQESQLKGIRGQQELKDNFPEPGETYYLTHADLNLGNIIYNDGKIEAIIDWELAGYYPWWVERWAAENRALSDASFELFDMVWPEIDPEHNDEQFGNKVFEPVSDVISAWRICPMSHSEDEGAWRHPRFCECAPHGGVIKKCHWGAELEHSVDHDKDNYWRG